jgi:hypothetical protein
VGSGGKILGQKTHTPHVNVLVCGLRILLTINVLYFDFERADDWIPVLQEEKSIPVVPHIELAVLRARC